MDKIIGLLALATLAGFLGILIAFVPSLDLVAIIVVVGIMAAIDFYLTIVVKRDDKESR